MPTPFRRRLVLLVPLAWFRPAEAETLTLDALMARLGAVPERRAGFIERRRFAALESVLESTGTLAWRRGWLEKVTTWPQPERLEVDGDRLVLIAGNDPPRVIDMARAPELRTFIDAIRGPLLGDAAALRRAFDPRVAGTMEDWTLDLIPRDPAAARLLRAVHLHGRGDQMEEITITQANGDEQAMTITAR